MFVLYRWVTHMTDQDYDEETHYKSMTWSMFNLIDQYKENKCINTLPD